jgi:hypothetical protein
VLQPTGDNRLSFATAQTPQPSNPAIPSIQATPEQLAATVILVTPNLDEAARPLDIPNIFAAEAEPAASGRVLRLGWGSLRLRVADVVLLGKRRDDARPNSGNIGR